MNHDPINWMVSSFSSKKVELITRGNRAKASYKQTFATKEAKLVPFFDEICSIRLARSRLDDAYS